MQSQRENGIYGSKGEVCFIKAMDNMEEQEHLSPRIQTHLTDHVYFIWSSIKKEGSVLYRQVKTQQITSHTGSNVVCNRFVVGK